MSNDHNLNTPRKFAAPAPSATEDEGQPGVSDFDRDLDALCERWVVWCRTRRLYGPAPVSGSVLGRLTEATRPVRPDGPNAVSSAELAAFHIAYICQPDALDKRVFHVYYVQRVKPVKRAADALGISRPHFYAVLRQFRRRVYAAGCAVLSQNEAEMQALQQRRSVSAPDRMRSEQG